MSVIHLKQSSFEKEISGSIPVIIDFWASWCGPCQMMGPVFEDLSGEYKGKLKFAKVNTEEEQGIAGKFSIRGIPTLIVVKDGKEIDRIVGFASKEILKEKIDEILENI